VFYPSLVAALVLVVAWMTCMPGQSHRGALPAADMNETELAKSLQADVTMLATTIGERNHAHASALERAATWIEGELTSAGYAVQKQTFSVSMVTATNLDVEIKGNAHPEEIVIVGAHYDSVEGSQGADDDASGIAAMLALARAFAGTHPARTLRFVAFADEEPPYFWTDQMGSLVYARACKERGDRVVAMLSLETVGYFRDERGTQKYPFPLGLLYPSEGNFIAFVGDLGSRSLVRDAVRTFRSSVAMPSEGAALPSWIPGVGWSDQWSFWKVGYPGVMVTDTAPFRNPAYHTSNDAPETLDYARFARVVVGVRAVIDSLVQ
jgi:Zn-dependent M28 family amino/carboxypeptidase